MRATKDEQRRSRRFSFQQLVGHPQQQTGGVIAGKLED